MVFAVPLQSAGIELENLNFEPKNRMVLYPNYTSRKHVSIENKGEKDVLVHVTSSARNVTVWPTEGFVRRGKTTKFMIYSPVFKKNESNRKVYLTIAIKAITKIGEHEACEVWDDDSLMSELCTGSTHFKYLYLHYIGRDALDWFLGKGFYFPNKVMYGLPMPEEEYDPSRPARVNYPHDTE